jgi:hypothetical protein
LVERLRPLLCWGAILALMLAPRSLQGQEGEAPSGPGDTGKPDAGFGRPIVHAFVLTRAGGRTLDPFGTSGRREVIQLQALGTPFEGRFLRARLDRLGAPGGWQEEGWYQIRGDTIFLYRASPDGGIADVEGGRYLPGRICMVDRENGQLLEYDYLAPRGAGNPGPPASPAPRDARCISEAARRGRQIS